MNVEPSDVRDVRELFEKRVPEIASGAVTIKGIVRDAGSRTILAVASKDPVICPVGSCVGARGATVKGIVRELKEETVDIVRWDDSAERFLRNVFAPMRFRSTSFDDTTHQATAVLEPDSPLLASSKVALQARLLRELTGWVIQFEMKE